MESDCLSSLKPIALYSFFLPILSSSHGLCSLFTKQNIPLSLSLKGKGISAPISSPDLPKRISRDSWWIIIPTIKIKSANNSWVIRILRDLIHTRNECLRSNVLSKVQPLQNKTLSSSQHFKGCDKNQGAVPCYVIGNKWRP